MVSRTRSRVSLAINILPATAPRLHGRTRTVRLRRRRVGLLAIARQICDKIAFKEMVIIMHEVNDRGIGLRRSPATACLQAFAARVRIDNRPGDT